jgi:acetyl-CoA synthetase
MAEKNNYLIYKKYRDKIFTIQKGDTDASSFEFPVIDNFNWVNDWFDHIEKENKVALKIISEISCKEYTYKYLKSRSKKLAIWLLDIGVKKKDRIFICLNNRVELFELLLATQRIGAISIPSFPDFPFDETSIRIKESKSNFFVSTSDQLENIKTKGVKRINVEKNLMLNDTFNLNEAWAHKARSSLEGITNNSNDPCFAYFTSGTTSRPKMVMHSYESYAVGHFSSLCWNGVTSNSNHFNISPPGWAKHTWSSFFVPWTAEATNVVTSIRDITATQLIKIIIEHKINTFCAPPTIWKKITSSITTESKKDTYLKEIVSAGEALDSNTIDEVFKIFGIPLRNGYGQSEATAIFGQYPGEFIKKGSVGKELPGYKVFLDSSIDVSNDDNVGEVCIDLEHSSIPLMLGYDQKEKLDVMEKYYRTGDIAYKDSDGDFFILGRNDHVFKTNDFRVSPYEFEEIINKMEIISKSAVIPKHNKKSGFLPLAFIVLENTKITKDTNQIYLHHTHYHI